MEKIFSINSSLKTLFFVLFLFSTTLQAQSILDSYEGIPIETSLDWYWVLHNPGAIDSMELAGVDIIHMSFPEEANLQSFFSSRNFDVLPITVPKSGGVYNWIQYYTDAKYSVWEAEGNPPSEAKLEYKNSVMFRPNNANYISLKPEAAGTLDTLIWGPYYHQDVEYETYEDGNSDSILVYYTADFKLMLSVIGNDNASPTDTLCILQVTQSNVAVDSIGWHLPCTDIIRDTALTRGDFTLLNTFKSYALKDYSLENFDCEDSYNTNVPPPQYRFSSETGLNGKPNGPRWIREYIQFKVIWLGNPNYSLSIDKIVVSDQRGVELMGNIGKTRINEQATTSLSGYETSVFGWLGIDEPVSIDLFEPIRIVDSLLNAQLTPKRLVIPFMGSHSGAWNEFTNPYGVMHLSKWQEFKKRVGSVPIIQNAYLFDTPCSADSPPEHSVCWTGEGFKAINIRIAAEKNYKQAYELDPNFGASLQCGAVFNDQANQRNVARHEVLYSANLALMYGAKYLQMWRYFPTNDIYTNSGGTFHGIVDWIKDPNNNNHAVPIYTDKYFMLKDTLSPRLKGLFGKTLKQLAPAEEVLGLNASTNYNLTFNQIERIKLANYYGTEALNSYIDIGTFNKPGEIGDNYFLVINRWYSDAPHNKFYIQFRNLCDFRNWNLMNYVDTTSVTLISDINGVVPPSPVDTIVIGDAILYSIKPVAEFGGKIIANETVNSGTTLLGDMTIENGATLTVNGTYTANANITVKSGGKIKYGNNNSKIVFGAGKKIIIEGTTEIKGSSFINKLTLEFANSEKGIDVLPGSSLTLSYCNITGAYYGIITRIGTPSYLNITYSNFAFGSTGIVLNGNYYSGGPSPTSIISNCNFTTWGTGLSVTNNNSVIISQNSFASCGISLLNVPAAYIQGNNISSGSNESYSGIFFNNSGGYIRSNIIKNRVNGIHLANSSPDIGGNIIEDNFRHGLFTGSGSIPNLVGYIQINPPLYFPLSGYNTIRNNGNNTQSGTENDGSEIYLSGTNIALRDGCNEISDDRQSAPNMSTLLLINGSLAPGGGRQLDARNNYWGTTTQTNSRFGLLSVLFTPYYGVPCPIPDGGGGSEELLVLKASTGEVVDTIYAAEGVPENFTTLEASYSEADNYFAKGSVDLAKPLYEQIVSSNYTAEEKLPAYNKLYTIGNLTGEGENYFNNLQSAFDEIANTETDTLLKKIYNQNAIKCDVSKEEYLKAISKFDNIIQQNPNSEEAIYAEIDIITTALNIDTTNTQLGKMAGGKYLVKSTSDYLSRLNDILQSKFGINSEEKEQIIPKEYSLHQNYPNPFNPTTTIQFDLPNDGLVQLEIFDILGRRIATLVEEYKTAGSYEQVFDASSLASGVYVYKLQASDFVSSKKMILLK